MIAPVLKFLVAIRYILRFCEMIEVHLVYFLWLFLLVFDFCFLSISQEIGWEEHLQNDLFCVEWDVRGW